MNNNIGNVDQDKYQIENATTKAAAIFSQLISRDICQPLPLPKVPSPTINLVIELKALRHKKIDLQLIAATCTVGLPSLDLYLLSQLFLEIL